MTHAPTCDLLVRNGQCTCRIPRLEVSPAWGRVFLRCPDCGEVADWIAATIPQLILAEQQHLGAHHTPDYSGVHDAVGDEGE